MRCFVFGIFFFLGIHPLLIAQGQVATTTSILIADSLMKEKKYEEAARRYDTIAQKFRKGNLASFFAHSINAGICLTKDRNFDEAIPYFIDLEKIHKKEINKKDKQLGLLYHKLAVAYSNSQNKKQAIKFYQQAISVRRAVLSDNDPDLAASINNTARGYDALGQFDEAIPLYKQVLTIRKTNANFKEVGKTYRRLGTCYRKLDDYTQSMSFYLKAKAVIEQENGLVDKNLASLYNSIGILLEKQKKYDESIQSYSKALKIYSHPSQNDKKGMSFIYNNLANSYSEKKDFQQALNYYLKAKKNYKIFFKEDNAITISTDLNIGSTYWNLGQNDRARKTLLAALELGQNFWGAYHPELNDFFINLGDLSKTENKLEEALIYYQQAIKCQVVGSLGDDPNTLPDIKTQGVAGLKSVLLESLESKAGIYNNLAEAGISPTKNNRFALQTFEVADQLIDLMRKEHTAKGSKLFWTATTLPLYEQAIETALELYSKTQDQQYLNQAFTFSEKSKSVLLLESIQDYKARQFAGIPPELLEKETIINQRLIDAEQNLYGEQQYGEEADSSLLKKFSAEVFELKQAVLAITNELEQKHPKYYQMKYNVQTVSIKTVQQQLSSDQTMLDYFVGEKNIYLFKITPQNSECYILGNSDSLAVWVNDFRASVYEYFISNNGDGNAYERANEQYIDISIRLCNVLLNEQITENLSTQLVIIPDGVLGYLPFDALLTNQPISPNNFISHPYLLKKHQISYAYSATLHHEYINRMRKNKGTSLLAFAPTFKQPSAIDLSTANRQIARTVRGTLGPLRYNTEEVVAIKKLVGGKLLLGKQATEKRFREIASDYQILHFATHGKANDKNADYSYLAFTEIEDSLENEFIYVHDLYGIRLNADLAVLSACETGVGELYRGEGIASLSRGFSYAGVPSIITTLWSVNDAKTSDIIQSFYKYLKDGHSKDAALRQAKLDYLKVNDNYHAHPFFWAAAIPVGDMRPIQISNRLCSGKLLLGVLFTMGISLFLWVLHSRKLLVHYQHHK